MTATAVLTERPRGYGLGTVAAFLLAGAHGIAQAWHLLAAQ